MAEDPRTYVGLRLKNRYLIEDHIGSGISAHAFRAYDTLLQGRVVVKIIKDEIAGIRIDIGEEWKAECRKAMQVRGHPHIASILDLGEENIETGAGIENAHFIITEYIDGRTLRDLASGKNAINPAALLAIAHQLISTLDFFQSRKLSHGDLHSGNIMVSELGPDKPFIKIIDFGMASNTLIPRNREKDIYFALNQLDHLCQKTLASCDYSFTRNIMESLRALIKKAQNFIPTAKMSITDLVEDIEILRQDLVKGFAVENKACALEYGIANKIDVTRRTPFFGRTTDLNRLYRITTDAFISKQGAMIVISGEAGVGKTRLVDEVACQISTDRTRYILLYARCSQEFCLPYSGLITAVFSLLDSIPGGTDSERLEALLGSEHTLIKPFAELMDEYRIFSRGDRSNTQEAGSTSNTAFLLNGFLTQVSLNTPILLFLDDLHWADKSTIDFMGSFAPKIANFPVVVFTTYRPEEIADSDPAASQPMKELIRQLDTFRNSRLIELGGLENSDFEEILSNLYTFVKPADFTLLSKSVRRMAGGNPFYLFEITGLMEDEGILVPKNDTQWSFNGSLSEFSVPPSINSLMQRRVDKLTLNEILFLRAAALQGDNFEITIVERMFTPSDETLSGIAENLTKKHGLIVPREPGRFSFRQHQLRRAILRGMSGEDVEHGHREIARHLAQLAEANETNKPYHLIAYHLAHAGESHQAAENFLQAGKFALNAQQYHIALDHLKNAADILQAANLQDCLAEAIVLNLLEAVKPLGEKNLHAKAVQQLEAIAEKSGRKDLHLRYKLEYVIYLRTISENEKALETASQLLEDAKLEENEQIEAGALKEAGTISYLTGNMQAAEKYFHQAAGILASTNDRAQLARVYNNLGLVCRNTSRQNEMIRYFRRALDIFREINDNIGQRFPLGNLGLVYFERGEYERAFECFNMLKASLGDHADLMMEAKVDFSLGEIFLEIGLFDQARESCERALQTFITIGNRHGESEVLGTLGGVYLAKNDIQLAREYFERSIEVKKEIGNMVGMLHSRITLARIANMEGRHEEGMKLAMEVLASARERNLRTIELECLTEIMQAKAQLESPSDAISILTQNEIPDALGSGISPALITFAYKTGELAFQAGDEELAIKYISLSGKIVESILDSISEPEWREAYEKKRRRILDTYNKFKSSVANPDDVH